MTESPTPRERFGFVLLEGWSGLTKTRVQIIGKTPKKLRIRALKDTKLAGRNRWIKAGDEVLVPAHCVAIGMEFARQLEHELAEAQQRIAALESMNDNLASVNIALAELRDTSSSEKDKFRDWLLEKAPDCGDNSCLFGGRGKGGMRTNGGCRCFKDVRPDMRRIFIERLWESFVTSATRPVPVHEIRWVIRSCLDENLMQLHAHAHKVKVIKEWLRSVDRGTKE